MYKFFSPGANIGIGGSVTLTIWVFLKKVRPGAKILITAFRVCPKKRGKVGRRRQQW
jgi:hypothetical protein